MNKKRREKQFSTNYPLPKRRQLCIEKPFIASKRQNLPKKKKKKFEAQMYV